MRAVREITTALDALLAETGIERRPTTRRAVRLAPHEAILRD